MKLIPTILLSALALAVPAAAQHHASPAGVSAYRVQLYSFGYNPSPIVLRAGQPVTLVLSNVATTSHTFKAPAFFAASRIEAGMAHEGEVHVKPHQTVAVTLVPARGAYPVHCSHFFHDQLGMHTMIYVQ